MVDRIRNTQVSQLMKQDLFLRKRKQQKSLNKLK